MLTFLGLREELARRCPDAEYFDLRFKDRIFVKPRAGSVAGVPGPGVSAVTNEPAPAGGER